MGRRAIDRAGVRYGKLVAIKMSHQNYNNSWFWECICDCGNKTIAFGVDLGRGKVRTCGCGHNWKHGRSVDKRLKQCFFDMHRRCRETSHKKSYLYTGKNITVCNEWKDFDSFEQWAMNNGYEEHLTLDRINSDKNYTPLNCRWATRTTQSRNKTKMKGSSSIYIGVCRTGKRNTWLSSVGVNKKTISLGVFKTELEAAKTRDQYIIDNNLKHFTMNF